MATKVWAHRGASAYAPENTMAAFKKAIAMGADGIELDVHMSADGKLMVIHDETVDRTTNGSGRVVDLRCAELKALCASNGMEGFENARIPMLKEIYGLLRDSDLWINVEIKCDKVIYPDIWLRLLELEREMGMEGRILYSSFNHYVLAELKKLAPTAMIGLLYNIPLYDPWVYAKYMGAYSIHPHSLLLQCPGLVSGCHENGVAVCPWTVDDEETLANCKAFGVDAVITGKPDLARTILG